MVERSLRYEGRNPLVNLPSAREIAALPADSRAALRKLLTDIKRDARARAEKCWRQRKAPMAAYWRALSVYAGHAASLCR